MTAGTAQASGSHAPAATTGRAARSPALILIGYGVEDTLQITVESQRVLGRVGKAYAISLPPNLARYLRSVGVTCVDLGPRLTAPRPFADAYLDLADAVLQQMLDDPPVVLLAPGNPLLSNALNRFLLLRAREHKLRVQVLPAVSPIDSMICLTALDLGTFGLQVFDARRLVTKSQAVNPAVPLLLLELAGIAVTEAGSPLSRDPAAYEDLIGHLRRFYPPTHPVLHLPAATDGGSVEPSAVILDRLGELASQIGPRSTLFIDLVRPQRGTEAAKTAVHRE